MANPSKVVIITTPTSATSSLWRIAKSFLPSDTYTEWPIDKLLGAGEPLESVKSYQLPERGLFLFNMPHLFNSEQDLDGIHFIFNFRDPRDLVCNQFHWEFSHPVAGLTDDQLEERRKKIKDEGIDAYVLRKDNSILFNPLLKLLDIVNPAKNCIFTSYVQLCLGTSVLIPVLSDFLGNTNDDLIGKLIASEHPSQLVNSKNWIGQKWAGSDVMPGRARVELKPETFDELTYRNIDLLKILSSLDNPLYSFFYGS
jgi:hypothetical protein